MKHTKHLQHSNIKNTHFIFVFFLKCSNVLLLFGITSVTVCNELLEPTFY